MQVTIGIGGGYIDGLRLDRHRGTRGILLEVITRPDFTFLRLQSLLLTVQLCQARHGMDIGLSDLIEERHRDIHLFMDGLYIAHADTRHVVGIVINLILFVEQFLHVLDTLLHRLLLRNHVCLQVRNLGGQALYRILDRLLPVLGRHRSLEIQTAVSVYRDTSPAFGYRHL